MALEIEIKKEDQHDAGFAPLGVDLPAAYIKPIKIIWHYQPEAYSDGVQTKGEAQVTFGIWASKQARETNAAPLGERSYVMRQPDFGGNLILQSYSVIKQAGKFATISLANAKDA